MNELTLKLYTIFDLHYLREWCKENTEIYHVMPDDEFDRKRNTRFFAFKIKPMEPIDVTFRFPKDADAVAFKLRWL